MLSGETAVGKYPVQAVEMMAQISDAVESSEQFQARVFFAGQVTSTTNAIGNATCEIAKQLKAKLIITATSSGFTARMISRHRPLTPIFAVTSSEQTQRRLALVWGVRSSMMTRSKSMEEIVRESLAVVEQRGLAQVGDVVVITAGVPAGIAGRTNMIQVRMIGETF
jgi:pyruvate kinase